MRLGERDHAGAGADARVSVIDGAGHACNLDEPAAYTSRIERFLDRTVDVSASD